MPVDEYFLLAALSTSFVRRQVRARQFSADIIDKIGDRHLMLRVPVPKDTAVIAQVNARVKKNIEGQTAVRSELRELLQSDMRRMRERAEARFGFTVRSSRVSMRILVPKYYDPALEADVRAAEKSTGTSWVSLGQLEDKGIISIEGGAEVGKMAYGTGNIPFVRTSDLVDLELKRDVRHGVSKKVYDEYAPKGTLAKDDIVLVRDGRYLVGSSAIVTTEDLPALYCGGILRLRVLQKNRKESFKREIRETIKAIEPDIP